MLSAVQIKSFSLDFFAQKAGTVILSRIPSIGRQKKNRGSMDKIPLNPIESYKDPKKKNEDSYCPHYKRSTCVLHFYCCEKDVFFPCHKCHNEHIAGSLDVLGLQVENERLKPMNYEEVKENGEKTEKISTPCSVTAQNDRTETHPHVKCSDAAEMKCTDCLELQKISSKCIKCSKEFAPYSCEKCRIFVSEMEMDPYHCDDCGICRAGKSNHKHCFKCNFCLDLQLYEEYKCMEDSGHDMCGVCLETVFNGCYFLPCSHKIHQQCTLELIQHGRFNCPICRSTFTCFIEKKDGRCEAFVNYVKEKGKSLLRFIKILE